MAREDWAYIPVEKQLIKHVDHAVKTVTEYGSKKYDGRKAFLVSAIKNQLVADGVTRKEKELAA